MNPYQWSFAKQSGFKSRDVDLKVSKEAEAKRDGVINPQNYNFQSILYGKFYALKRYESTVVDRRTWLHVPSGTHWSTCSDTHQVVEIEKETSTKMYTPSLI